MSQSPPLDADLVLQAFLNGISQLDHLSPALQIHLDRIASDPLAHIDRIAQLAEADPELHQAYHTAYTELNHRERERSKGAAAVAIPHQTLPDLAALTQQIFSNSNPIQAARQTLSGSHPLQKLRQELSQLINSDRSKTQLKQQAEAELTQKITHWLPPDLKQRWDQLREKRDAEILTDQEYEELLRLSDEVEKFELHRMYNLDALSHLTGTPFRELSIKLKQIADQSHGQ